MGEDDAREPATTTRRDDQRYLESVLGGDRAARAGFVDRFARLVHAVIERTLRRHPLPHRWREHEDQVEDLFAEVFLALFERDARRLRQWSGRCSLATWIRLVTASVVIDRVRRQGAEPRVEWGESSLEALASSEAPAPARIERAEELAAAFEALERLSARDRELLVWLLVEEQPADVVAERLGISLGALYTRKNRAIERLRRALVLEGV